MAPGVRAAPIRLVHTFSGCAASTSRDRSTMALRGRPHPLGPGRTGSGPITAALAKGIYLHPSLKNVLEGHLLGVPGTTTADYGMDYKYRVEQGKLRFDIIHYWCPDQKPKIMAGVRHLLRVLRVPMSASLSVSLNKIFSKEYNSLEEKIELGKKRVTDVGPEEDATSLVDVKLSSDANYQAAGTWLGHRVPSLSSAGSAMAAVKTLNLKAEYVLRTNLGPKGTMKMLVSGAGDIKLTKDGNVLLHEMQIQHATASLIAKVATAQDDITGDGITSNVLIIGELLKQGDLYISEGLHPRIITEGFEAAKEKALQFLKQVKLSKEMDRETLIDVARTSLRTKVHAELADVLTEAVVDSILAIKKQDEPTDLFMSAEEREKLVKAERKFIEDRFKKMIDLQTKVCGDSDKGFVVINQKGIDPFSLDALSKEGIVALHRAKTRNMERLTLICGGVALNSLDNLNPDCLGHAGLVYEYTLGEEKFTFIEKYNNPRSVTLLIKGPNKHTLTQIKDAIRDGLRAVKNAIDDGCVVPGAGAVEVAMAEALIKYKPSVKGRAQLGVQAFADALFMIPKVLAQNSVFDLQETLVKVQAEHSESGQLVGVDLNTGEPMVAAEVGIRDNYCIKKQLLHSYTVIATNILLVDEIMRAGMSSLKSFTNKEDNRKRLYVHSYKTIKAKGLPNDETPEKS
ncbi:hypothetical protein EI555_011252 [Monodon monoceros]|uniref:T-complex protein 1 subunit zeta n=1 Tax=Monodon monoceros TaxID=40151 RepID=A0A4U1EI95_MONMO|nr:hypothetical protein EI555_011252 [Monodon monoceros]